MKKLLSMVLAIAMILSIIPTVTITGDSYSTPDGFNENDYQKLVSFALQGSNLEKLG